jgi:hypothetical protein
MIDHWNERCEPPWTIDELSVKVANAYRYAQNRPGERTAEAVFASVALPPNYIVPRPAEPLLDTSWRYPTLADVVNQGAKEPKWVVEDYFPVHSINMLFGDSGTLKTTIGLDLAMCIATGAPWQGKEVKKGTVLFILAEGNFFFHFRIKAWLKAHPEITTPLAELPFVITDVPVHFDNKACIDRLIRNADYWPQHYKCALQGTFIDTLNLNIGHSRNESDTADAGAFMSQLGMLFRDRYGCATWALHHVGKKDVKVMRGAKVFRDASDTNYLIECAKDRDLYPIMTCTKMKDFVRPPTLRFEGAAIDLGTTKKGKPITAVVLHKLTSGNPDPTVFDGCIMEEGGTREELLELLKKPRSSSPTGEYSIWALPGFKDRTKLKILLGSLLNDRLITSDKGFYRGI